MKELLSKAAAEKAAKFQQQIEGGNETIQELNDTFQDIAQAKLEYFKTVHQDLSTQLSEVKALEEAYNHSLTKGGILEVQLTVHPADGEKLSQTAVMSNDTVGRNGGLLSYRNLTIGNWFGYQRAVLNGALRQLESLHKPEFAEYQKELRQRPAEA